MISADSPVTTRLIFISYSRQDGQEVANRLRRRLSEEYGFEAWQDQTHIPPGKDWWQEIVTTIKAASSVVLVVTPLALTSEWVRKESRLARQEGKHIFPIKGAADLDFRSMPRWMRDSQFVDIENPNQWQAFIEALREPPQELRVPFMAEELSSDFVARPAEYEALIDLLLARNREDPVAITAALRGAGGYGKTTLACAICHDERIQEAFRHGILWVTLGEKPEDLVGKVEDLIYTLSGERPGFSSVDAAVTRLAELLADRDILLVIDDVWSATHLKPFLQGGQRCARLITTRNSNTVPAKAHKINVDAMQPDEATTLLSRGLPQGEEAALAALAKRLFKWPLLLTIINGVLRDRIDEHRQPLGAALEFVNKALDVDGLTAFDDPSNPEARNLAVRATLKLSLNRLKAAEHRRYSELVIFPEDTDIPLAALERLWDGEEGLSATKIERFCDRLNNLSLLQHFDPVTQRVRLHDVVRAYLLSEGRLDLPETHARFLGAYRVQCWADLPPNEPYLWDHLAFHLLGANRGDELVATVKNLIYLAVKTHARSAYAAEADLIAAENHAPRDATLRLLRQHFANAGHLLAACTTLDAICSTLHSRLQHLPALAESCRALERRLRQPGLTAYHPLPDLPRPALMRTLRGHTGAVKACTVGQRGDLIVSASADKTLRLWDAHTGAEYRILSGHTAEVSHCAIIEDSPQGDFIVSASADKTLRLWDARTGAERLTLCGHKAWVRSCAISPQGDFIVSASDDKTLRVWEAQSGETRKILRGHTAGVHACAISPQGDFIVSASEDMTLRVWETQTGALRMVLRGHTASVNACAISPDSSLILSASNDQTLKLWEAQTGALRLTLKGHTAGVYGCAFSARGDFVVSASDDKTLKVWDVQTGQERFPLTEHTGTAWSCAVSPADDLIVSTSDDRTLRLWDPNAAVKRLAQGSGHSGIVWDCAVNAQGTCVVTAAADETLRLWELKTGTERLTLRGHTGWVRSCAFSPKGDLIASAAADETLKLWEAQTGAERATLIGHTAWVRSCAFSPKGDFLVSAADDKTLRLWDVAAGRLRMTLHGHLDWVNCCAVAPNGKFILSASRDMTLKIWNVQTGMARWTMRGHKSPVLTCAIHPNSESAVSGAQSGELRLWNLRTGAVQFTLAGHTGAVTGCAFSPAGDLIFSTSEDQTLRVWDAQTGKGLAALHVDGALHSCAVHPGGRHIIATGHRGVYFLRLVNGKFQPGGSHPNGGSSMP